ncbi:hypothetical protein JCM8547_003958 [Rhodosporidiobolus lusitaniae]
MSTSFHPETNGRSERTNKTAIQILRQHVSRQQKDWVRFLPSTEFAINTAVNDSTGATPVELVLGYSPSLFHSSSTSSSSSTVPAADEVAEDRRAALNAARDALAAAKVCQAEQANRRRGNDTKRTVGTPGPQNSSRAGTGHTLLWEFFPDTSTARLTLPPDNRAHPVFHTSKLKVYTSNPIDDFPSCEPPRPDPIDVDGEQEWVIEEIVDEKGSNAKTKKYLVKWAGYPDTDNTWKPASAVEDTVALDTWEAKK